MENKEKNLDSLTQELSAPKDPAKRKTLKKLFGILIGTAGVTTAPALLSSCAGINVKDKINVNFSNRTPSIRRKYPKVYEHFGRQDFDGHLRRRPDQVGIPGIDYYASTAEPFTEIASAAKGVVYMWKKSPIGGLTVYILHGLGYITSYAHMRNLFVGTGENFPRGAINLPRGAIIGSGGGTGFGGAIYPHTHFNVFGPVFTPYLRNIVFHKMQNERYPWQFPTDGEQFAIDNSRQLPFIHKGDFAFDDVLWQKHLEASKYLDTVLKEINTERGTLCVEEV